MGEHTQFGIVCCSSIEDYENQLIKRHEFTLAKKELDRTKLTDIQCANVGPVFLTYREKQEEVKARMAEIAATSPHGDVTCDDGVRHVLWRCSPEDSEWFTTVFGEIPHTYVADGHHRAAAAYNVGKIRREKALAEGKEITGEEPFNYFMTLLYPADNLLILDYNRVLKTIGELTPAQFLEGVKENYTLEKIPEGGETKPSELHTFSLLMEN